MRYTGVDGCRGGWCVVTLPDNGLGSVRIEPDFEAVWKNHRDSSCLLVDIPIGLLECMENGETARRCDVQARTLLGKGASRVFPAPCRQAVYASNKSLAKQQNIEYLGKSLSEQTLMIAPKIREVDELLLREADARAKVFEVHPEILFYFLAGGKTLPPKRSKAGEQARKEILKRLEPRTEDLLNQAAALSKKFAALDDVLDALACAVTALKAQCSFQTIPENVPKDAKGLPMQMVYWKP